METIELIAQDSANTNVTARNDTQTALKFITCGSVDDGKSTLIGRLLVDSRAVLQDQLSSVQRAGATDLALLTDGLSAEREQGITIDVAYRYFATAQRKFIIGDAPGHEQYTRNMVTAASSADAAVVLVDATKLDWQNPAFELLPQTRRHALLCQLLRVPSIVFAVNKLDAVEQPDRAFAQIRGALTRFAAAAGIPVRAVLPISALEGFNVVDAKPGWCDWHGDSLLQLLERLPAAQPPAGRPFALPVQWVEKSASSSADTSQGRRVFWGRIAEGAAQVGDTVQVQPGGQRASIAQVLDHARRPAHVAAGRSAGIVLDRELDVSRGDWLLAVDVLGDADAHADDVRAPNIVLAANALGGGDVGGAADRPTPKQTLQATVAWLDDEPLVAGRVYLALHGHRWIKARVTRVLHGLNVGTLAEEPTGELRSNAIGRVELALQQPAPVLPYAQSRTLGALVLVDAATHKTAGAVLIH